MDYFLLGDFDFLYSYLFRSAFITDIIPGALSGLLFGYLVYLLYLYIRPKLIPADSWVCPEAIYSDTRKRWITYAIWFTILLIALFNGQLVSCLI